jgi:GTPase SAR1 family protein
VQLCYAIYNISSINHIIGTTILADGIGPGMVYGQIVVGPPGSGKSTYCHGLEQFFSQIDPRPHAIINLDPANDELKYSAAVDIRDLISLEKVQEETGLGPNGGLVFSMEYLEENIDWLKEKIDTLIKDDLYLIFDLPGQVELWTCHQSLLNVIRVMNTSWGIQLASVQLVDSHLCTEPGKYLSALLVSLSTMLHLGLPHVNVLSKVDMLEQYGELDFQPQYFLQPGSLEHLAEAVEPTMHPKFSKATFDLCNIMEDYSIVKFAPLAVEDVESMTYVIKLVDKATGYAYTGSSKPKSSLLENISLVDVEDPVDIWTRIQERARQRGRQAPDH